MKTSPFPGMDPYLERRWGDVHVGLIAGIRAALNPQLPPGLQAVGQESVRLEGPADPADDGGNDEDDPDAEGVGRGSGRQARSYFPDVAVIAEIGAPFAAAADAGGSVATVEPIVVRFVVERQVRRWVEIIDLDDGDRVVTAIEVLSPKNKGAGEGSRDYRRKLLRYLGAGVNVVEIDLIRSSRDRLLIPAVGDDRGRPAAYYTCVNWARDPDRWKAYPMPLRNPLPTVPVPLRTGERDVPLTLQPVLDRAYADGGHYRTRYARPLDRPLSAADAAWAAERVAAWSAGPIGQPDGAGRAV